MKIGRYARGFGSGTKLSVNRHFAKSAYYIFRPGSRVMYLDHSSLGTTTALCDVGFSPNVLYSPNIHETVVEKLEEAGANTEHAYFDAMLETAPDGSIVAANYDGCGCIVGNRAMDVWLFSDLQAILDKMSHRVGFSSHLAFTTTLRAGPGYPGTKAKHILEITREQTQTLLHNNGFRVTIPGYDNVYTNACGAMNMYTWSATIQFVGRPDKFEDYVINPNTGAPYGFRPTADHQ